MPSRHIGGSRQGHPRYTDAREGRPWVAHNTIDCATNVHNQKTDTTVFNNVHGVAEPRILQRTERRRVGQEVDGQFVGIRKQPRHRDREHKETRQAGGPESRARSLSTKSRMRSCRSWKTNSTQLRTRVTCHQHSRGGKAQHHPRAERSQSVDGRQEVQRWIGRESATNHCETVPNHLEDCAVKESVLPEK